MPKDIVDVNNGILVKDMISTEEDMICKDQTEVLFVTMTEVLKETLIETMAGRITQGRFVEMTEVIIRAMTEVMIITTMETDNSIQITLTNQHFIII
jgi:hypothetical protein